MVKHTQTIRRLLPTNCLNVFDHVVGLALKGIIRFYFREFRKYNNDVDIGIKSGRGLNPPNVSLKEILKTEEGFMISFYRSSHWRCSVKKSVLKNFVKFTGKHLRQSLFCS